MEHKPLISIMTPCHRVIPWFNARLINVCSQSFKDWEWIILDNSKEGCVKKYVEDFFVNMQGVHYPECRDKIKCVHEPFSDVTFENGRMGKLRNRCIELSQCGNDGWIVVLDSDDFIYDGFLENISIINDNYANCEFISGMNTQALVQYIDNGSFFYHSSAYVWNDNDWHTEISILRENGFNGTGFNEYANDVMRRFRSMSVIDYESSLPIPHIDLMFKFRQTTALNKNGFPFITSCGPPLAYKKGAFLKKIGGYVIEQSIEDEIIRLMPFVFDNIVYIKRPCYLQCTMYKNALERDSASVDVIKAGKNNIFDKLIVKNYNRIYQIIGDCRNFVEPIWFE